MEEAIRVTIIHSNRLFREGLAYVLSQWQGNFIVTSHAEATGVMDELHRQPPDIIVMTLTFPGQGVLNEVRQLLAALPTTKILMVGLLELESHVLACIEAGVAGYLLQEASLEELIQSIRAIATGEAFCSPRVASLLFSRIAESARERERRQHLSMVRLTRREIEIVVLIEKGLSNKEVAVHLQIELQTVKNHVHNILEKLQLDNRREAALYAREQGLLEALH